MPHPETCILPKGPEGYSGVVNYKDKSRLDRWSPSNRTMGARDMSLRNCDRRNNGCILVTMSKYEVLPNDYGKCSLY